MSYSLFQSTKVPHQGLLLFLLEVTFDKELLKLPCILLYTDGALLKVVEF